MGEKMKLNRKGFMLAEVVVSASVVAVVLVTMYIGINRMTAAYDKRNRYYDLDAQQVAMEVNDLLKRDSEQKLNNFTSLTDNYYSLEDIENNYQVNYSELKDAFSSLEENINTYYVKNEDGFNTIKNSNINQSFKDYLDYFINKTDFNEDYSYFIVVELDKNNNYYYYTLKVK